MCNLNISSILSVFLDPCKDVKCAIKNEICDISDGICKCGTDESCENKSWAPTCDVVSGLCSCGSNLACSQDNEICDESSGACFKSMKIL